MERLERTICLTEEPFPVLDVLSQKTEGSFCFFDIETTGLSPRVSSLFLIGALWYDPDKRECHITQWFADDYISEAELITSFADFLSGFSLVVHYNGSGFDIPYVEKKCGELNIPSPFENIEDLDIYREIRRLKPLFGTENLRLATVEKKSGFMRRDNLSGKDCIQVYSAFMQKKYFKNPDMEVEKQKLLLHNMEDVIGTCYAAGLLCYRQRARYESVSGAGDGIAIHYGVSHPFPFFAQQSIPLAAHGTVPKVRQRYTVRYDKRAVILELPLVSASLLHFFPNYKDYYYLPEEDTAIHKSVGAFVEPEFRQPAKARSCYTKKAGVFFPVPKGVSEEGRYFFRESYQSKQNYVFWDQKEDAALMEEILAALCVNLYGNI